MGALIKAMSEISEMQGKDSVQNKIVYMANMFSSSKTDDELRYIVRSFANTGLRIGLSTKIVENVVLEEFQNDLSTLAQFEK